MPASDKRVAANRANAAKSTGPRTPEGKEKSKFNAVRHGLTAQASVLPGEDPDLLDALSKDLMRQLKPRGTVQLLMAERIVSLAWKLRRVARAEEAVALAMEEDAINSWKHERAVNLDLNRYIFPPRSRPRRRDSGMLLASTWHGNREHPKDERLLQLTDYELKLDAALRAGMRELLKLQKEAGAFEEVEDERAEAPLTPPAEQNEPNDREETHEEDPGLRCAAPAACGDVPAADVRAADSSAADVSGAREAPDDKTNPMDEAEKPAQVTDASGVTPDSRAESSAPARGTSSSPRPGPRR